MGRALGFALLLGLLALIAVAPGSSKSTATFHDAIGDHPSGRPDIDSVVISNDDYGALTFDVTLRGERLLSPGDFFFIFLDTDLNEGTGSHVTAPNPAGLPAIGADRRLRAIGTSGFADVTDCTWDGGAWSNCKAPESTSDTLTGENMHSVRFTIRSGATESFAFRFLVGGTHVEGGSVTTDIAPDSTEPWRYDASITPDFDRDGLRGEDDLCPHLNAHGSLDRNHNGCPGPFKQIRGVLKTVGVASGGATTFRRFALVGVPPGTRVVISSGRRVEQLTASASGVASSQRFKRRLRDGTPITIRATKALFVGSFAQYRIQAGAKLVGRTLCIPAYGPQRPTPCRSSLLGR